MSSQIVDVRCDAPEFAAFYSGGDCTWRNFEGIIAEFFAAYPYHDGSIAARTDVDPSGEYTLHTRHGWCDAQLLDGVVVATGRVYPGPGPFWTRDHGGFDGLPQQEDAVPKCAPVDHSSEESYASTLASEVAAMKTNFRNCEVLLDNNGGGRYVRDRDGSFKKGNVTEFWFVDSRATMLHKKITEPVSLSVFASAMEAVGVKFNDTP